MNDYLIEILEKLLKIEQSLSEEKEKLAEWEEEKDYSILGTIELLTGEIRGYAFQILNNKIEFNYQETVEKLKELNLFDIDYFSTWYYSEQLGFLQLKNYIAQLNYLRLLLLEYLIKNSH